jgi:hypothetical protein
MNFLKKWFNKVISWMAHPIAMIVDKATALLGPAITYVNTNHNLKWSFKTIAKVVAGALLVVFLSLAIGALVVAGITGFTLLFALVLPSLLANLIAVLCVGYVAYQVFQKVDHYRADEIVIEIEVETEAQA